MEVKMNKRYIPKTKIICTLGPASSKETVLRKMVFAGMDVARINFSHSTYADYISCIETIRKVNKKYRRRIRILGDLEGPRIRVGYLKGHQPVLIEKNKVVYFVKGDKCQERSIPFDYKGSLKDIEGAKFIYVDDGNIVFKIKSVDEKKIKSKVVVGGLLTERKGINIPGAKLRFPSIIEKDTKDIEFAIDNRFDFIAQSFVRRKKDIIEVRKRVKDRLPECQIISKIEDSEGIRNIDSIMDISDGIMIARGDMGVSIPIYKVPLIQKEIIKKCIARKKFVITATHMLEHMVEYPIPTRAEVTDIANAVIDGTDYVMLSAETAVGKYPAEAVKMMNAIIKYTELRGC